MSDESPKEIRHDCRKEFDPITQKYRRHVRIFTVCILTAIIFWFVGVVFQDGKFFLFWVLFMLCIVTGIVTMLLAPKLRCPRCGADAGGELETYCPECGGAPLEEGWWFSHRCPSCRKRLYRNKGRSYRVRFCTNCSAYLDDAGV